MIMNVYLIFMYQWRATFRLLSLLQARIHKHAKQKHSSNIYMDYSIHVDFKYIFNQAWWLLTKPGGLVLHVGSAGVSAAKK